MVKAALILAASVALGLATLAGAQDADDEQFWSINDEAGPWWLQRAACILAHNEGDRGTTVIWLRFSSSPDIEFVAPRVGAVREDVHTLLIVTVDGVDEEFGALGVAHEDGRRGYRFFGSDELFDRIGAGRRLEISTEGRELLAIDLANAGPAIAALRACNAAVEADIDNQVMEEMNAANAL